MLLELDGITSYSMHCKLGFFFHDGSLHTLFYSVEDALRVRRVDLLPDEESLAAVRPTLSIRI